MEETCKNLKVNQALVQYLFEYRDGTLYWKNPQSDRVRVGDKVGHHNRYTRTEILGHKYYVHRLVWLYHYGEFPVQDLDHIDGNRANNSIENLRPATRLENNRARLSGSKNRKGKTASKYKGVLRRPNRWHAAIVVNKKRIHLGSFKSEEDAAKAYNTAALQYFGAFATLNIIPEAA